MELDDFVCDRCGRVHEACVCFDIEEEFYSYLEYLDTKHQEVVDEDKYPKFNGSDVEVSEGVVVSKDVYEKYYK